MLSLSQTEELVRQSQFIFGGTILQLHASTMPMEETESTAIVKVNQIIESPEIMQDLTNTDITVKLPEESELKVNEKIIFFTEGWIFGKSIAVIAHGLDKDTDRLEDTIRQIRQSKQSISDKELRNRLDLATLCVKGRVVSVKPSAYRPTHLSEHDPDWQEATIEVESAEKGKLANNRVVVHFPNSNDIRWHKALKFKVGDRGIWNLHQGRDAKQKGVGEKMLAAIPNDEVFTALDSSDFLPEAELNRVRSLMKK